MSKRKKHTHEIKAYAAFSRGNRLVWSSIKPTREEAQAIYNQHNPSVDGYENTNPQADILPIYIGIDKGFQYDIEDTLPPPLKKL